MSKWWWWSLLLLFSLAGCSQTATPASSTPPSSCSGDPQRSKPRAIVVQSVPSTDVDIDEEPPDPPSWSQDGVPPKELRGKTASTKSLKQTTRLGQAFQMAQWLFSIFGSQIK